MKRLIALLFALTAAIAAEVPFKLTWTPAPDWSTNTTIYIVHSTNMVTPLASWQVVTNAVDTNVVQITIEPGVHFFAAYASNMWGISPFSNVYWTPPQPVARGLSGGRP